MYLDEVMNDKPLISALFFEQNSKFHSCIYELRFIFSFFIIVNAYLLHSPKHIFYGSYSHNCESLLSIYFIQMKIFFIGKFGIKTKLHLTLKLILLILKMICFHLFAEAPVIEVKACYKIQFYRKLIQKQ